MLLRPWDFQARVLEWVAIHILISAILSLFLFVCWYVCVLVVAVCVVGEGDGTPLQYSCLEIPWTEEPGRLRFMGSLRVGHD